MRAIVWVRSTVCVLAAAACGAPARPFALRAPLLVDTDLQDRAVPCRPDPTPKEPDRKSCMPAEYVSPFVWDQLDNILFARLSRGFSLDFSAESVNVNSLDEVPDSAWFTNRARTTGAKVHDDAPGACVIEDMLPSADQVADGAWTIDHGKDNGSTVGFRVKIPDKGLYLFKADDEGKPERASAASVIGAAVFDALGFNTSCEQIVTFRKSQLVLSPGLKVVDNSGVTHPFDQPALDKALEGTTHTPDHLVRMQASKWLPGVPIGPFRYVGTRADDPNDVVAHQDRRELRGMRVLSAWLDHWDSREQNSMDLWIARDAKDKRSSPGRVTHYILDTSDTIGGDVSVPEMSRRLGYSYTFDFAEISKALVTFGADERPWDHAKPVPGREKFNYFRIEDFDPTRWKPLYPNPAFLRTTERDAAWMARLIARFSADDIRQLVMLGQWHDPTDLDYLTSVLLERQRRVLVRYLGKLSPLGEIRQTDAGQICATDFARLRGLAATFRYTVVEHGGGQDVTLAGDVGDDGALCFRPRSIVTGNFADADPARRVRFEVHNGTAAGPLVIHAYDLGPRGVRVVGVTRPNP